MKAATGFALGPLLALAVQAGVKGGEPPTWSNVSVIFVERCVMCHSDKGAGRELRLDSYEGVVSGSINGPVVIAGNSQSSELIRRLRGQSQPRMPFLSHPLPEEQIDLIARWIEGGLLREADDATNLPPSIEASDAVIDEEWGNADR